MSLQFASKYKKKFTVSRILDFHLYYCSYVIVCLCLHTLLASEMVVVDTSKNTDLGYPCNASYHLGQSVSAILAAHGPSCLYVFPPGQDINFLLEFLNFDIDTVMSAQIKRN